MVGPRLNTEPTTLDEAQIEAYLRAFKVTEVSASFYRKWWAVTLRLKLEEDDEEYQDYTGAKDRTLFGALNRAVEHLIRVVNTTLPRATNATKKR